ncbi:MAG: thioredoxin family protein [Verrucomicrobiae bacterium]|nr:thioredoxin family protein [Verrucomicrobiae bacterium]
MKTPLRLLSLMSLIFLSAASLISAEKPTDLVYVAHEYDPKADADQDLARAKKIAAADGRRILLVVGGNWCPWCRIFANYIETNEAVRAILAKSYVIQKVNVSDETSNTGFLNPYPAIEGYPHLFILDASGKLLHSQDSGDLEKGRGYDEATVVAILSKWAE